MNDFGITALLLFFGVFVMVAIRTFRPGSRAEQQRALQLPLHDGDES